MPDPAIGRERYDPHDQDGPCPSGRIDHSLLPVPFRANVWRSRTIRAGLVPRRRKNRSVNSILSECFAFRAVAFRHPCRPSTERVLPHKSGGFRCFRPVRMRFAPGSGPNSTAIGAMISRHPPVRISSCGCMKVLIPANSMRFSAKWSGPSNSPRPPTRRRSGPWSKIAARTLSWSARLTRKAALSPSLSRWFWAIRP